MSNIEKNIDEILNGSSYIHENIIGSDCQLVTAINAYYHTTGKMINSKTYDHYVDLCGCRTGAAINIKVVWDELSLIKGEKFDIKSFDDGRVIKALKEGKFLGCSTIGTRFGYHSIGLHGYDEKTGKINTTNFISVDITLDELKKHISNAPCQRGVVAYELKYNGNE